MKIMITGSNGQLGRELIKQLQNNKDYHLYSTDVNELDITILDQVLSYVENCMPDVIINCAAYTAVDKCEVEEDLAFRINAIGPRNLAIAANKYSAKIVQVSTDYVFDGEGNRDDEDLLLPYTEFDPIMPQSVYGRTKAGGEAFVKDHCSRYFIVRTAWLYGDGNNFVKTMLALSEKHPTLKVVNDQVGSPTSTYELAKSIISLIITEEYGIYHGTCLGQCSWYDFAKKIFEIKGIDIQVSPCTTEEFPRPAKRPAYSVLNNKMFKLIDGYQFSNWEDAINKYLREM